ncbi:MAG: hypothetical protein RH946_10940 [Rhodospirillales bacterium]|tara:strand:- start:10456 stop:11103 length:648 start_codon:yes stop_codon:yes gene_type:complete
MNTPSTIALAAVLAFALTGCDRLKAPDTSSDIAAAPAAVPADTADVSASDPEGVVRPQAVESTAGIDWDAARRDMASVPSDERGQGSFQVQSGSQAAPVPVLLPTGIVVPQSAEGGVKFQPMSDGYFATYPGVDYDIVVNGTNEVIGARDAGETTVDTDLKFVSTASGAQVIFSRYGADYLIEFECKNATGASPTCITEDDALAIARKLVIAGTR